MVLFMAKRNEHSLAVNLRKQGMSYSQIKKHVTVSKSSLSLWLHNYPLPEKRLRELRDFNEQRIENFRRTMRLKRETRLAKVYEEQKLKLFPLTQRDLLIGGLCLYWGEGGKTKPTELTVSNTDPSVILFSMHWLQSVHGIAKNKFKVKLQLYRDMDVQKETSFWSKILKLPRKQFVKPYIKKTESTSITYRRKFSHGTCDLRISNVNVAETVFMGIKYLGDSLHVDTKGV